MTSSVSKRDVTVTLRPDPRPLTTKRYLLVENDFGLKSDHNTLGLGGVYKYGFRIEIALLPFYETTYIIGKKESSCLVIPAGKQYPLKRQQYLYTEDCPSADSRFNSLRKETGQYKANQEGMFN